MLDEEYSKLLEYKIKGYSRIKIAMKLNITEYTVDKMVQKLKKKITKIL
jgi:DNA-binding NarL/FixJ family response regulator